MDFGLCMLLFKKDGTNKERERMNNFVSDIITHLGGIFYPISI